MRLQFTTDKTNPVEKREGYLLVIKTYIGDADGDEYVEIGPVPEGELSKIEDAIEVCDRLRKEYPHGRGGSDNYKSEGFEEILGDDWPCHEGIENSFSGYKVYFLEDGRRYPVTVTK